MRLTDRVYLVGSGRNGFSLSDPFDCNVYVIDGGSELALIDAGAGRLVDSLIQQVELDGLDPQRLRHVFLTHKHADHAGGASAIASRFEVIVHASQHTAEAVSNGDQVNEGLERARRVGTYPPNYVFHAVTVTDVVREGQAIQVGDVEVSVLDTPGHCDGHCCFTLGDKGRVHLFTGDSFFGGRIVLQVIPDCSLKDSIVAIEKLADVHPDVLLPGHLIVSLHEGYRQLEPAMARIRAGYCPELFVDEGVVCRSVASS